MQAVPKMSPSMANLIGQFGSFFSVIGQPSAVINLYRNAAHTW